MSALSIIEAAEQAGYTTFAAALRMSGHGDVLAQGAAYTVFAPNEAAFQKFTSSKRQNLLEGDADLLRLVIGHHIAAGRVMAGQFAGRRLKAVMLAGGAVIIDGLTGLRVNSARVLATDIAAANGVIHGLDSVLWPKAPAAALGA